MDFCGFGSGSGPSQIDSSVRKLLEAQETGTLCINSNCIQIRAFIILLSMYEPSILKIVAQFLDLDILYAMIFYKGHSHNSFIIEELIQDWHTTASPDLVSTGKELNIPFPKGFIRITGEIFNQMCKWLKKQSVIETDWYGNQYPRYDKDFSLETYYGDGDRDDDGNDDYDYDSTFDIIQFIAINMLFIGCNFKDLWFGRFDGSTFIGCRFNEKFGFENG